MQAVIMAGGKGTRLKSLTRDEIPKPLAPINGKPILQWQIECLRRNNITEICIAIGYLGEKIREAFGDGSSLGVSLHYYNEETLLGTAGALAYLSNFIREDIFFLAYGDCVFDIFIERMMDFHRKKKAAATLFAHPNSHPYDSDLLLLGDNGCVKGILPKNAHRDGWYDNMVNAGVYILSREVCDEIPMGQKVDLEKDYLANKIPLGTVYAYHSTEYVKDAGTPDRIQEVAADLESGMVAARNLIYPQKCVFLDRDGTMNHDPGLIHRPEDFELFAETTKAIRQLNKSGFLAIIVTNQPVVARGLCDIETVEEIHRKLKTQLGAEGAFVDAIYYCPHHPDKGYPEENPANKVLCGCRKPGIDMINRAIREFNITTVQSWFVGDTTTDIQTGKNAGLKTALVLTGCEGQDGKFNVSPDITCENLADTVNQILEGERNPR